MGIKGRLIKSARRVGAALGLEIEQLRWQVSSLGAFVRSQLSAREPEAVAASMTGCHCEPTARAIRTSAIQSKHSFMCHADLCVDI
jgi:hypothetical protein